MNSNAVLMFAQLRFVHRAPMSEDSAVLTLAVSWEETNAPPLLPRKVLRTFFEGVLRLFLRTFLRRALMLLISFRWPGGGLPWQEPATESKHSKVPSDGHGNMIPLRGRGFGGSYFTARAPWPEPQLDHLSTIPRFSAAFGSERVLTSNVLRRLYHFIPKRRRTSSATIGAGMKYLLCVRP